MARATYLAEVIAMKRFVFSAVLLISALLAAESGNVSYIQFMENEGTIIPADKPEKIAAQVNYPLYPGDVVDTQSQGRMELALADGGGEVHPMDAVHVRSDEKEVLDDRAPLPLRRIGSRCARPWRLR